LRIKTNKIEPLLLQGQALPGPAKGFMTLVSPKAETLARDQVQQPRRGCRQLRGIRLLEEQTRTSPDDQLLSRAVRYTQMFSKNALI